MVGSFMQEAALPWGCSIPRGHFEYTHTHRDLPGFLWGPLILGTLPSSSTPPSQETPSVTGPTAQVREPLLAAMPPLCVPMIQGACKGPRGRGPRGVKCQALVGSWVSVGLLAGHYILYSPTASAPVVIGSYQLIHHRMVRVSLAPGRMLPLAVLDSQDLGTCLMTGLVCLFSSSLMGQTSNHRKHGWPTVFHFYVLKI